MDPIQWNEHLLGEAEEVCRVARECSRRGWLPATAGNFSFRDAVIDAPGEGSSRRIFITPSGLDKGSLSPSDLLEIDPDCRVIAGPKSAKPSAETSLHGVIYRDRHQAHAIFHVHTIANTLLPERYVQFADPNDLQRAVVLENYELLKALSGVTTHQHRELVPILNNSQDYPELARKLAEVLEAHPFAHGVLLDRHGLYAWGESIAAAWRHLEALEFLFEVELRRR